MRSSSNRFETVAFKSIGTIILIIIKKKWRAFANDQDALNGALKEEIKHSQSLIIILIF